MWDPKQYLIFEAERSRAAADLLARAARSMPTPSRVVDLGCGPGNSTALLTACFPGADVTGIDSDPAMLERARADMPETRFAQADVGTWMPDIAPDLIFANAVMQWVPDQARVLPRLLSALAPGGVLAVQVPRHHESALHLTLTALLEESPWRDRLAGMAKQAPFPAPAELDGWLRPHAAALDLWETIYQHRVADHRAVAEWLKGTTLRPALAVLDAAAATQLVDAFVARLETILPRQPDGAVLMPFRRLFLVAQARA